MNILIFADIENWPHKEIQDFKEIAGEIVGEND